MLGSDQMMKYHNTTGCYLAAPRLDHKTGTGRRWQTPPDLISHPSGGGGGSRLIESLSCPVRQKLIAAYMAWVGWTTGAVALSLDNLRQPPSPTGHHTMTLLPSATSCLFSLLWQENEVRWRGVIVTRHGLSGEGWGAKIADRTRKRRWRMVCTPWISIISSSPLSLHPLELVDTGFVSRTVAMPGAKKNSHTSFRDKGILQDLILKYHNYVNRRLYRPFYNLLK